MEAANPKHLFPIMKHGKFGFIDANGCICLEPVFDRASTFSEGLARVQVGDKWGFIDTSGEMVVAPVFDSCLDYSEGFAVVTKGGKQGFINRSGEITITLAFYRCDSFREGLAKVQHSVVPRPVFVNSGGTVVLDRHNYLISKISEGLINCSLKERWGYINKVGDFIIPAKYVYARSFSEGLAAVSPHTDEECVFIDKQGNVVIETPFEGTTMCFSEGFCVVWSERGGFGYIDRAGNLVIKNSFYFADDFSEGMAVVQSKKTSGYGFVNQMGDIVVNSKFTVAEKFENGLASVTIGERYDEYLYGYINKVGEYVWEPTR